MCGWGQGGGDSFYYDLLSIFPLLGYAILLAPVPQRFGSGYYCVSGIKVLIAKHRKSSVSVHAILPGSLQNLYQPCSLGRALPPI